MSSDKQGFKKTEIGLIPEDWKVGELNEIAIFRNGKSSPERDINNKYYVFGSNGIIGKTNKINSEKETIIIGRVGSYCGSVYYSKDECWVTDNAIIAKPKNNSNSAYIFYLLKRLNLNQRRGGSGQPLLNQFILNNIKIVYPPLPEQKAIAKVLSDLDDKIELNNEMNRTLEEIGQALFKRWFIDFEFPDENGDPYRSSGGEMVYSEELGKEIPEGWEVKKIIDLPLTVTDYVANGGFADLRKNVKLYDTLNYALFVRNVDLKVDFLNKRVYVDKHSYEYLYKTKLFGGELIISNVGDVGSIFLCPYFEFPMTLGNNIIMLKSENLNNFLYYFFKSSLGQGLLRSITSGSAQPKFNKTDFRNLEILLPNNAIIDKFKVISKTVINKIFENKKEIENLTRIRDSLLPKLMSGEIRVPLEAAQ